MASVGGAAGVAGLEAAIGMARVLNEAERSIRADSREWSDEVAAGPAASDASRPAKSDGHAAILDDDRHIAVAEAVLQHPLQRRGVLLDVEILEHDVPPLEVCTGGLCVRSGVLAEDLNHSVILPSLFAYCLRPGAFSGSHPVAGVARGCLSFVAEV